MALLLFASAHAASAQARWTVYAAADSVGLVSAPDQVAAEASALQFFVAQGYFEAVVDSVVEASVHVRPGERFSVQTVTVTGATSLGADAVTSGWRTRRGAFFVPDSLAADLEDGIARYLASGRTQARLTPRVTVRDSAGSGVDVAVDVIEGPMARVARVELFGGRRASAQFASRVVGLSSGALLLEFDAEAARLALVETDLFLEVGEPVLSADARGDVVIRIPIIEAAPGAFDIALGYLPPSGGASGQVVGSGRVELRNPFGSGRTGLFALVRNPGLTSSLEIAVRDPFVAGLPFGAGLSFLGYGRDSTFSRQAFRADGALRVGPGLDVSLSATYENVDPGAFGAQSVDGLSRVRAASSVYVGAGVTYRRVDSRRAPTRGLALNVEVEQGTQRVPAASDSLGSAARSTPRSRLAFTGRVFVPTLNRQTVVLGVDARMLVARRSSDAVAPRSLDVADLFRLGGSTSLRGYDEEAFVGQYVGRGLAEYRLLLDSDSYAFAFADIGYVRVPAAISVGDPALWHPGYGAGMQLRTGVGLATITYALNPDLSFGRGKIHVGLRVGL